jgi:dienelactone hydrolase
VESNGYVQAEDAKAVLDHVVTQPWADKGSILVMGQSHGGWTTLAFGTLDYPGVRGLVNFAGGLRQDACAGWQAALARAAGPYGRATRVPSIWFYGDNDSYFAPTTFRPVFESYVAAGGKAELVAFGEFSGDAHTMFGSRAGEAIWQPRVQAFMQSIGLPTEVRFPALATVRTLAVPASTSFAALQDVEAIPFMRPSGREGYRAFLTKSFPRAFALSPSGAWGWAEMGDDPLERALANCNKTAKDQACRLYAVNADVVWSKE